MQGRPERMHRHPARTRQPAARRNQGAARKTMLALVPPKPKLFDSATSIGRSCADLATRSIGLSREAFSRFRVGGATLSRIARIEKIPSTAPAAPSRCPIEDLV